MLSWWFRIPFWQRVMGGFALGILAGLLLGPAAKIWLKPIGDLYISLVKMVVVPLVLTSIVAAVANLHGLGNVAWLGAKTVLGFLVTSALAVVVGILVGNLLDPGLGVADLPLGEVKAREIPSPVQVLLGIVPTNPFKAIYPAIASIFIAQYMGIPLGGADYLLIGLTAVLGSLGTAGVPGTSIVMLTLTLNTVGLPLEGIGYIIAIDRVIDMMRTMTNVTGQLVVPVLVAKSEGILDEEVLAGERKVDAAAPERTAAQAA
jgi:Na+/H+-dicarboxylate symporter